MITEYRHYKLTQDIVKLKFDAVNILAYRSFL